MTPLETALAVGLCIAIVAAYLFYCSGVKCAGQAIRAEDERDAALAAKAREWEESQRQIADARGTITRRADERDAAIVRLNRAANVIAAARSLSEYPPKRGEWKWLRDALAEYDGGAS